MRVFMKFHRSISIVLKTNYTFVKETDLGWVFAISLEFGWAAISPGRAAEMQGNELSAFSTLHVYINLLLIQNCKL